MTARSVLGVEPEFCAGCGGVWFDPGELGRIARGGSSSVDAVLAEDQVAGDVRAFFEAPPRAAPAGLTCPACSLPLESYSYCGSDAMLHNCPGCQGVFVAQADLARLRERDRRMEASGLSSPSRPVGTPGGDDALARPVQAIPWWLQLLDSVAWPW